MPCSQSPNQKGNSFGRTFFHSIAVIYVFSRRCIFARDRLIFPQKLKSKLRTATMPMTVDRQTINLFSACAKWAKTIYTIWLEIIGSSKCSSLLHYKTEAVICLQFNEQNFIYFLCLFVCSNVKSLHQHKTARMATCHFLEFKQGCFIFTIS